MVTRICWHGLPNAAKDKMSESRPRSSPAPARRSIPLVLALAVLLRRLLAAVDHPELGLDLPLPALELHLAEEIGELRRPPEPFADDVRRSHAAEVARRRSGVERERDEELDRHHDEQERLALH